jgi:pyrroloquinoline-quinone synthase
MNAIKSRPQTVARRGRAGARFARRIRRLVDEFRIEDHPFLVRAQRGALDRDLLLSWAQQDRHVSHAFPRLISQIVASLEGLHPRYGSARALLVENLWEECGEGDPERAHAALMDALLTSMGVDLDSAALANVQTQRFIDLQLDLARARPIAAAGAFCYGNEYLVLKEYPPIWQAVVQSFPGCDERFFKANWEADGRHTELVESALDLICQSRIEIDEVEFGAETALRARIQFYDALVPTMPVEP